jgi:hypothetical protein
MRQSTAIFGSIMLIAGAVAGQAQAPKPTKTAPADKSPVKPAKKVKSGWADAGWVVWTRYGKPVTAFYDPDEAVQAAQGDDANPVLKANSELLVFRVLSCPDRGVKVLDGPRYEPYRLYHDHKNAKAPLSKALAALQALDNKAADYWTKRDALVTQITAITAKMGSVDSSGTKVVPYSVHVKGVGTIPLTQRDSGSQLLLGRYSDAAIYAATNPCGGDDRAATITSDEIRRVFGDNGVPNGFADPTRAITVAQLFIGTKVVLENGGKNYLYVVDQRQLSGRYTDPGYADQFQNLTLNPGFKLVAVVGGTGNEALIWRTNQ